MIEDRNGAGGNGISFKAVAVVIIHSLGLLTPYISFATVAQSREEF